MLAVPIRPPHELPSVDNAEIVVCSGAHCQSEAPCPWCLRLSPFDDWKAKLRDAWIPT